MALVRVGGGDPSSSHELGVAPVIVHVPANAWPNEKQIESYGFVSPRIQKEESGEPEH